MQLRRHHSYLHAGARALLCSLLTVAALEAQRTIFVDRSGKTSSILHLRDALAQARPGDEVVLRPGYYNLPAQSGHANLTIRGDRTGVATVQSLLLSGASDVRLLDLRFESLTSSRAYFHAQGVRIENGRIRDSSAWLMNCSLVPNARQGQPALRFDDCLAVLTGMKADRGDAVVSSWNSTLQVLASSLPSLSVVGGEARISGRAVDRIETLSCTNTKLRFSGVTITRLRHSGSSVAQERPPAPALVAPSDWVAGAQRNVIDLHTTRKAAALFVLGTGIQRQSTPFGELFVNLSAPWVAIPAAADAVGMSGIQVDLRSARALQHHTLSVQALVLHANGPAVLSAPWSSVLR